jgi:hypothetical protein
MRPRKPAGASTSELFSAIGVFATSVQRRETSLRRALRFPQSLVHQSGTRPVRNRKPFTAWKSFHTSAASESVRLD